METFSPRRRGRRVGGSGRGICGSGVRSSARTSGRRRRRSRRRTNAPRRVRGAGHRRALRRRRRGGGGGGGASSPRGSGSERAGRRRRRAVRVRARRDGGFVRRDASNDPRRGPASRRSASRRSRSRRHPKSSFATRVSVARRVPARGVRAPTSRRLVADGSSDGVRAAASSSPLVTAARCGRLPPRRPAATAFDRRRSAGTNLAALDDACSSRPRCFPPPRALASLDDVGDGRGRRSRATRELVSASPPSPATPPTRRSASPRARCSPGFRVEGYPADDATRATMSLFDDLWTRCPRLGRWIRARGSRRLDFVATASLTRATCCGPRRYSAERRRVAEILKRRRAARAPALVATRGRPPRSPRSPLSPRSARRSRQPPRRRSAALLELVVEHPEARPPEEGEEDEEDGSRPRAWCACWSEPLRPGAWLAAPDARALCGLSRTDAFEEPSAIGASKARGVADQARSCHRGTRGGARGPAAAACADDAVDRAPEERWRGC